jgi:serine/threonine-protein kinase
LSIGLDAARGLDYAHGVRHASGVGVLHRDVSPGNLLLAADGTAKLADFGIAHVLGRTRHTQTGIVKGKLGYLAPELLDGHPYDVSTDVFALAATFFYVLTGVAPFAGRTEAEIIRATLAAQPLRLSTVRPDVPMPVERWIAAALSRDPGQRPTDLSQLSAIIERCGVDRASVRDCLQRTAQLRAWEAPTRSLKAVARTLIHRRPLGRTGLAIAALAATAAFAGAFLAFRTRVATEAAPVQPPQVVATSPPAADLPIEPSAPEAASAPATSAERVQPAATRVGAPAKRAEEKGLLEVRVRPWAQVFVDGVLIGATPLPPRSLAVGRHRVRLVNESLAQTRDFEVQIRARQKQMLKVSLENEAGAPH